MRRENISKRFCFDLTSNPWHLSFGQELLKCKRNYCNEVRYFGRSISYFYLVVSDDASEGKLSRRENSAGGMGEIKSCVIAT